MFWRQVSSHRERRPKLFALSTGVSGWGEAFGDTLFRILYYPADAGLGDVVGLGELAQAHAAGTVADDSGAIDLERGASDVTSFQAGAAHAGFHSFNDQRSFQLGDCGDDDHDRLSQRPRGVDVLPVRDIGDVKVVELGKHFD